MPLYRLFLAGRSGRCVRLECRFFNFGRSGVNGVFGALTRRVDTHLVETTRQAVDGGTG